MNKKTIICMVFAAAALAADQLSKTAVRRFIGYGESVSILPGLSFTHVGNTGAAFSMLAGFNLPLLAVGVVMAGFVGYYLFIKHEHQIPLALLLGGILGNLADRAFLGGVTDFIDISIWPIFNIADMLITTGAILLAYQAYLDSPKKKPKKASRG
jgi:signal peptidase II